VSLGHKGDDPAWLQGPPDRVRRRPRNPQEARDRLPVLAQDLEARGFRWPASAIRAYLSGRAESLDVAFGLSEPKSHKRGPKPKTELAPRDAQILVWARGLDIKHHLKFADIAERVNLSVDEVTKFVAAYDYMLGQNPMTTPEKPKQLSKENQGRQARVISACVWLQKHGV
jgi:hypothetical protein